MSERSAPYPFLRNDAQMKYNSQLVDLSLTPLFEFYANDEWVYLSQSPFGGVARSYVGLSDEDGGSLYVDEPFFVSGKKRFFIQQTTGFVRLILAKRRELISWNQDKESFDSNSAGQTALYNNTFLTPSIGAGKWAYLDQNLQWQVATAPLTPNGMPFGWGAPQVRAGRYYNVEMSFLSTLSPSVYYVVASEDNGAMTAGTGILISPSALLSASLQCTIGDEPYHYNLSGFGRNHAISSMKTARLWTIGIVLSAVAQASGFLTVLRRGF